MPSSRAVKAGSAFLEWSMRDSRLRKSLARLEKRLMGMGQSLQRIGKIGMQVGGAIAAAFGGAAVTFAKAGDQLHKMSLRTGISAQALSELKFAAEQSGSSIEDVSKAIFKLNRRFGRVIAGQGSSAQVEAIKALGLSVEELEELDTEGRFLAFADAMANLGDNAKAAGLAQRILGTSVDRILPLLLEGKDGIAAYREEANALAITLSDEDAQAAAELTDALNRLWQQVKQVAIRVGAAVAGPLTEFLARSQQIGAEIIQWIKDNGDLIRTIAATGLAIGAAGAAVFTLGTGLIFAGAIVASFSALLGAVGAVLGAILTPIGALVAGLAGLTTWFVTSTETGKRMVGDLMAGFAQLKEIVMQTIKGISNALAAGDVEAAGKVLWAGLNLLWLQGTAGLREKWKQLMGGIAEVWHSAWAGILQHGNFVNRNIERGWSHLMEFFGNRWDMAIGSIQFGLNKLIGWFQKAWAFIRGASDEEFARIDAATAKANQKIATSRISSIGERSASASASRSRSEALQQAVLDQIGRDLANKLKGNTEATRQAIKQAEEELKSARNLFAESTSAAEELANSAEAQKEAGNAIAAGIGSGMGGASGTSSRGIFNVNALQSLVGGPNDVERQTAENTKKTAALLAKIEKKNGLVMTT